jgi:hypothetical protein
MCSSLRLLLGQAVSTKYTLLFKQRARFPQLYLAYAQIRMSIAKSEGLCLYTAYRNFVGCNRRFRVYLCELFLLFYVARTLIGLIWRI